MQSVKRTRREMSRLVLTITLACMMAVLLASCETTSDGGVLQPHSHPEMEVDFENHVNYLVDVRVGELVDVRVGLLVDDRIGRLEGLLQELVYAKECHSEVLIEVHEVGSNRDFMDKLNHYLTDAIRTEKDERGRRLYTGPKGMPIAQVENEVIQRFVDKEMADWDAINRIRAGNGIGYYFKAMAETEFENIKRGVESLAESNGLNVPLASARRVEECDKPSAFSRHVSVVGEVEAEEVEEEFVEINVTLKVQNVSDSSTVWLMPEQRFLSKLSALSPAPIYTINDRVVPEFSVPYGAKLPKGGELHVNIRHSRVKKEDVPLGNVYAMILRDTTIARDQFRITRFSMVEIDKPNGSFPDQPLSVDNPAEQPACPPSEVPGVAGGAFERIIGVCQ